MSGPVGSAGVRVLCVAGARPNFMKVKPVMDALERLGAEVVLVHTGQHYDAAMSEVFLAELGIRAPDHLLGVGSGTQAEQTAKVMVALEPLVARCGPDVVVVVGDVNSTVAAALVAAKAGCLVAHVEAGLRSREWSMPEEVNRVVTDRLSDYLSMRRWRWPCDWSPTCCRGGQTLGQTVGNLPTAELATVQVQDTTGSGYKPAPSCRRSDSRSGVAR